MPLEHAPTAESAGVRRSVSCRSPEICVSAPVLRRLRGHGFSHGARTAAPAQATAQSTLVNVPMMKRSATPVSSWLRSSG